MALYDKASLVLIPSGTKEGTVFSQKPTNGDGDFTFSRASAATRVNSEGLIEKETQNLLLQSNTFDTTWATSGTLTSGQSGYDGSSDAWLFANSGITSPLIQSNLNSGVQTFSAYFKKNASYGVRVYIVGTTNRWAFFNLSNGTIHSDSGLIDSNVEAIGTDWYRCSITYNDTNISVRFYVTDNVATQVLGSIIIQDAQLNQGLVADPYLETTTAAVYGGITDNVPRLDYTDASCPSLLLEPQRTNLVIHSEYLEGLNQNSADLSLSSNLSPEGKYNAYRAEWVTGSQIGYSFAATNGETYTTSVYARSISGSGKIKITDYQGTETEFTITSEWARYELTATATQSTGRAYVRLKQSGDVVEFYGLQSELGSYATSYIPTYGSSVTRNISYMYNTSTFDNILVNQSFTWYFEVDEWSGSESNSGNLTMNTLVPANERVEFRRRSDGDRIWLGNINGGDRYLNVGVKDKTKFCVRYDGSQYVLFYDGEKESSPVVSAGDAPNGWDRFSTNMTSSVRLKEMLFFPTALTDQEAIDLTTI